MSCQAASYKLLGNTLTVIAETIWKQSGLKTQICDDSQNNDINKTLKIRQRKVLWKGGQQFTSLWRSLHLQSSFAYKEMRTCGQSRKLPFLCYWIQQEHTLIDLPRLMLPTAKTANIWLVLHFLTFGIPWSGICFSWNIHSNNNNKKNCNWPERKWTLWHKEVKTAHE